MNKIISWAVYGLIVLCLLGAIAWVLWPVFHTDIGKKTITATNAIVTNQAAATNAAVEKRATNAAQVNVQVEQRASRAAARTRTDRRPDPAAYNDWLGQLCSNDIYAGYADCIGHRGEPASKGAR